MPALSSGPDTIVLVHGFWVTPRSWEHWITHYEAKGYRVLAPAYPGFEVEVEALNRDPSPVEHLTVAAIMTHLEVVVERLEAPPILMGHSAGGAFVQLLLDRGYGAVGVAINSAPTEGVRVTPLSQQNNPGRLDDPINIDACEKMLMHPVATPSKTPQRGLFLRTFTDPDARWNNDDRTNDPNFISYQFAYLRLANFYYANDVKDLAKAALDTMQARIPPARVKYLGIAAQSIARLYKALGDDKGFRTFIAIASKDYDVRIEEARKTRSLDNDAVSAYLFSAEAKIATGDAEGAITLMNEIMPSLGERERLPFDIRMMQAQAAVAEKKGDKKKALETINALLTKYGQAIASHPDFAYDFQTLVAKRMDLMHELGVQDTIHQ